MAEDEALIQVIRGSLKYRAGKKENIIKEIECGIPNEDFLFKVYFFLLLSREKDEAADPLLILLHLSGGALCLDPRGEAGRQP